AAIEQRFASLLDRTIGKSLRSRFFRPPRSLLRGDLRLRRAGNRRGETNGRSALRHFASAAEKRLARGAPAAARTHPRAGRNRGAVNRRIQRTTPRNSLKRK